MLVFCPECGHRVSISAPACPGCGRPIAAPTLPQLQATLPTPQRLWSPGVAAVLSFLFPGLGQMYKGSVLGGLCWMLLVFFGYAMLFVPGVVLHLLCIFAAASGNPYPPEPKPPREPGDSVFFGPG